MRKVSINYDHDPRVLTPVYLAITFGRMQPTEDDWVPAYRDTVEGKKVIWARFYPKAGNLTVWVRDNHGDKAVKMIRMRGDSDGKSWI